MWNSVQKICAAKKMLRKVRILLEKYGYSCDRATKVRLDKIPGIGDLSGETPPKGRFLVCRQGVVAYLLDFHFEAEGYFCLKAPGSNEIFVLKDLTDLATLEAELLANDVLGALAKLDLCTEPEISDG